MRNKTSESAYMKLYKQIQKNIVDGVYPYNTKLPSKRNMATESGVSVISVAHAYDLLRDEGYIRSVEKSGYYVDFRASDGFSAFPEEKVSLNNLFDDSSHQSDFPVSVLAKTMRNILTNRQEDILMKSPNAGLIEFREAIARYLARNKDMRIDPTMIVIGSGAEYLYNLIAGLLGEDRIFAIEDPSYAKIRKVYKNANINYELLPLGKNGIESSALIKTKASVLHISPFRSYPTGITASASKRHEYIRWADSSDRIIVEDDFESEFSIISKPVETLFSMATKDNVIYLNTFSKTISPALRVGYMVLPKHLVKTFEKKLGFYSCTVPTFEQLVLTELLNNGSFERHINRMRRKLRSGSAD
ncbi:MAG: PLP-dependent aminotransferase family protein [Clostridiales bacterium]|nr:PLP-dependent aminotransferase family protein [Clostridiales bacterium]